MRVWQKKIALLLIGTLLGVGTSALLWRALQPKPQELSAVDRQALRQLLDGNRSERGLYLFDPELGYRFKPRFRGIRHQSDNALHVTNSRGLLGTREPLDDDSHRILFLGDSVAYGDGVGFEEIFSERVQAAAGASYQVFNAACPGWRSEQELRHFERDLSDLRWDMLVLTVSLNDLVPYRWSKLDGGEYRMTLSLPEPARSAAKLLQLRAKFRLTDASRPLTEHDGATLLAWSDREWDNYLTGVLVPFVEREDRPRLVIAMLPSLYQLQALERGLGADVALLPQRRMASFAKARDLHFTDASKPFIGLGEELLNESFRDYLHFSAAGAASRFVFAGIRIRSGPTSREGPHRRIPRIGGL